MRIGINGAFLRRPGVGIGQVSEHVLRNLPTDTGHEYLIYTEEAFQGHPSWIGRDDVRIKSMLPSYWQRDDLIRKTWWERALLPREIQRDGCHAFVSLFQSATTLPDSISHTMVVHDIIPRLFPAYLNNSRKRLSWHLTETGIRRAKHIVTVSEYTRRDICEHISGIDPKRVKASSISVDDIFRTIPDFQSRAAVLEKYQLSPGYIYHGGGFEVRKNTSLLLNAYARLKERYMEEYRFNMLPKLVLSGRLRPELAPLIFDVERRVRELGLEREVKLLGFVAQSDLPAIYSGASLFVYPSKYEGFGMPVLEAMCQGVPVLCSNASSLPEVGGDAVQYFDPTQESELVENLYSLLKDHAKREELAKQGWERSKQFSWESFVRDIFSTL